jgi:asparagine synthase (glutamine-hydrolysing)
MCGIAGYISLTGAAKPDERLVRRMCRAIEHRGPDGEGIHSEPDGGVVLGHRRLSIIDLATGAQPMCNSDGSVHLVFNGEIYNFLELKRELAASGAHFRTTSDTEVIIASYERWGVEAFDRLNGIFAIALLDRRTRSLHLVRDHYGVKPLYYITTKRRLLFGSEIKAVLQDPEVEREMDLTALDSFLTFRFNPSPQTLFRGVRKLSPGHRLTVTNSVVGTECLIGPDHPVTDRTISYRDAEERYAELLEASVSRQMVADVPVGLLLSGGIDSAAVGMLMRRTGAPVTTYTIGFDGAGEYNELDDARASAQLIGSTHFDVFLSQQEYLDFFHRSSYFTEEPIASTTIPALYFVCQLAAKHVKVVLAGQGADEPLAGYPRYVGERLLARYAPLVRAAAAVGAERWMPRSERIRRAFFVAGARTEADRFLALYTIFTPKMKRALLRPEVASKIENADAEIISALYRRTAGLADPLDKVLFIDTRFSLSDSLLMFGDKMSMANSLEMRVPFLDRELIRFLETIPSRYKLRGGVGKFIHKRACTRWLPAEVIGRKKRGFTTPMDQWLCSAFGEEAEFLLTRSDAATAPYFDPNAIRALIAAHRSGQANYERQIFALLSLELWHTNFFRGYTPVAM